MARPLAEFDWSRATARARRSAEWDCERTRCWSPREAAFATILLVGAGLLLHSFWSMLHAAPGYRVESVITAELSPGRTISASFEKTIALYGAVREKMASYPGVINVAAMSQLPLTSEIARIPSPSRTTRDRRRPRSSCCGPPR